jgi:hypothetical protein
MMAGKNKTRKDCRSPRSRFNEINGRHEETRTPDLYRVKAAFRRNLLIFNGTHCQFEAR